MINDTETIIYLENVFTTSKKVLNDWLQLLSTKGNSPECAIHARRDILWKQIYKKHFRANHKPHLSELIEISADKRATYIQIRAT